MADRMTALEAYRAGILTLPPGYELEFDADELLLRRDDGSVVAGFGAGRVIPSETWARRAFPNLIYFHEAERGGHFKAWEEPELFSEEVRAAFRSLR